MSPSRRSSHSPRRSRRSLPDFTELVDQVGPAVVNIRTIERARGGSRAADGQMDEEMQEFFRRFFGVPMPNNPNTPNAPMPRVSSARTRAVETGARTCSRAASGRASS
jgi:serine protease Do